ncbi:GGDEF domain-containing protein [Metabacillus fastidiosus]|uniref:GGDEF domain-containing protein n=2 Tax=Metabacillus fastidiosus TaxID=1458 RepID=UPI003D29435D
MIESKLEVNTMYRDLIINLALIISFLSILGQVFKHKPMSYSITNKIVGGFIAGILGITLMSFSIEITHSALMDLRTFAIIIAMIYGGLTSAVTAGIIIAIGRIFLFEISIATFIALGIIILLIIACTFIQKTSSTVFEKFLYMNIANIVIVDSAFLYLIGDIHLSFRILIYYGTISMLGGFIIYYLANYTAQSNENFRKLKEHAQTDFLTGLNNVRQFDAVWNTLVNDAKEKKGNLSLLLLDIDHFKNINDTYGHGAGDSVLKELGKMLKNSVRSSDIVSRNGGEEFSFILPNCPNDQALKIAEKIRRKVEEADFFISKTEKINITISIGVATFPGVIQNPKELLEKADKCLYKAKHSGRNRVISYI